jgi:flagellar hook-associated protein 2
MPTHITGFSGSGIDIESMIQAVLEVERIPMYRLENDIAVAETKLSSWGAVETSLSNLHNKVQALTAYSAWQQIAANSSDGEVASMVAESNAAEGTYDIHVTTLAASHRIRSEAQTDISSGLGFSGAFTLGGVEIAVAAEDSLSTLRDAINSASATMPAEHQVRASIIDTTLVLERKQTGATPIQIDADPDIILESLGLVDINGDPLHEVQAAGDLTASINGVDVVRASNTGLTDVVDGVTLNLFQEGDATVSVARDTASIRTLIEDFVEAYNEAANTLEQETTFDVDGDSAAGRLQGDSTLRGIQFSMRRLVTTTETAVLDPELNSLRKIGVWTTGEDNRIQIVDGEKLDDALLNQFQLVEDLFRNFEGGILKSMDGYLDAQTRAVDGSIANRQQGLRGQIDSNWERIATLERRMEKYEESLWIKFAAMEQALGEMNQQFGYITGLFGNSSESA